MTGSINSLQYMLKLNMVVLLACTSLTGSIETAFTNCNKLNQIKFGYREWQNGTDTFSNRSTNISGNINVFADKYDMEHIMINLYSSVNGDIKNLKNLKKLWYCHLWKCSCTGSKTDLWNDGANIKIFYV